MPSSSLICEMHGPGSDRWPQAGSKQAAELPNERLANYIVQAGAPTKNRSATNRRQGSRQKHRQYSPALVKWGRIPAGNGSILAVNKITARIASQVETETVFGEEVGQPRVFQMRVVPIEPAVAYSTRDHIADVNA